MFKIKDAWQIVEAPPADEGSWTDTRDGQSYNWKKFGNQTWMLQNFNYGGKNGDWVNAPNAQSEGHAWRFQNTQDYQNYESEQGWSLGAYYTLSSLSWAVPEGWHIPTRDEIATLIDWATTTYGQGASGDITAKDLGLAALMTATSLWGTYLRVPVNKHNLSGMNMSITDSGYNGSSWGQIYTPSGYVFSNGATWWLADDYQGTKKYTLYVSESGQYSSSRVSWTTTQTKPSNANEAYPIRLIRDPVTPKVQPIITEIVTSLGEEGSDNKIATEKATVSAITSAMVNAMTNPMTSANDLIVGGTSGSPERLEKGEDKQILTSTEFEGVKWEGIEYALGADNTFDNYMFYTQFEDKNSNAKAGIGYENKLKTLGMGSIGNILSLKEGPTYEAGMTQQVPYWRTESDVFNAGSPIVSAGDIIVGGTSGEATVLAMGSQGQVLTVGVSGLEWANGSSGGDLPITTKGDMVIGDENGDAIRMPIGTSGQTLMVTSGGDLAYCDILTRSSVTWGSTIGTYTTSATSNNFLDIRGNYGYNTYDANTKNYSGVMMKLNNGEFRVNTDSVVIGAPYDPSHAGAFFRGVRKIGSYGANTKMILIGESGGSAGMGGNYTSAYTSVGNVALAIATDSSNGNVILGTYNNSNRATTAIANYNINSLLSYTGYGANVQAFFPTNPGNVPEWSGASYNSKKSYVAIHATQTNGDGLLTVCSSATNKYGDTNAKCETVGFRVRAGWSAFDDKVSFNTNAYFRNGLYARKLIVGVADWSGGWGTRPSDGGIIYGFGVTSARDAITSYGKDPGRQYYTTDDNRVNVYNNTTSGWDKIAYLSDVGGGSGGMVAEIGDMFSRETYGVYSDAVSFLYRFNPKSNTLHGGYFIPTQDNVNLPENISFSAVVFEGEGSWYDTVTKVAETSSFDTTNLGTDKKFRFTFEDTQLDDDKNYWLLFSIKELSGQGDGCCLTSFAVNSNDMSNLAVAYSTDIITEKEDFDMYSQEPSSYMPYVVLV